MRISLRPLLPNETDRESLSVFVLIPAAILGRVWLKLGIPLPACPLKAMTGCPCPGCGATRAAHALLHGDPKGAFTLNPLATLAAFAISLWCVHSLALLICAGKRRLRIDPAYPRMGMFIRISIVAALITNWIWVATHLPESPWFAK